MKNTLKKVCAGPKDIIALIIVISYCVVFICTALLADVHFNELLGRQFERLLLLVAGFYFGSHKDNDKSSSTCPYVIKNNQDI